MEGLLSLPSPSRGELHEITVPTDAKQLIAELASLISTHHV